MSRFFTLLAATKKARKKSENLLLSITFALLCGFIFRSQENCNWKGESSPCNKVIEMVKQGKAIPVCPEQLGGLTTPRAAAEQKDGCVIDRNGQDLTAQFIRGANEGLKIAQLAGCKQAILKARSPSCGAGEVPGDGVFAKLLKESGIEVVGEEGL